jgi:hypothetical protein
METTGQQEELTNGRGLEIAGLQPRQKVRQRDRWLRQEGSMSTCRWCVGRVNGVNADCWFATSGSGGEMATIQQHSHLPLSIC